MGYVIKDVNSLSRSIVEAYLRHNPKKIEFVKRTKFVNSLFYAIYSHIEFTCTERCRKNIQKMVTKDPNGEIPAKKLTKIITKNRTV